MAMVRPPSSFRRALLLLLLFACASAAAAAAAASGCRWNTHHSVALLHSSWPRLPPSIDLAIVQLRDGIAPTGAGAGAAGPTALPVLPPGLHLFLDSPVAGTDTSAGAMHEQLLPLLNHSTSLSKLRPLLRQFAEVAPGVAVELRRVLGFKEEGEKAGRRQLLWYHANDPGLALPHHEAIAAIIRAQQQQEEEQHQQPVVGTSLMGYQLTLSSPQPRLSTYTCPAASPMPPAPSGRAELEWTAAEPPGLHRQVSLRLALPRPTATGSGSSIAVWQRARLLVHLPQGAYMDTYELAERHEFFPGSSNARRPKLVAGNGFIDVELPASHSAQHAVGLEFQLQSADQTVLEATLPIHVRYPRPADESTAQPYAHVLVSRPLLFLSTTRDGDDWEPVPMAPVAPLSLRVPAGEGWLRGIVVWVTLAAELLGALVVGWALLRLGPGSEPGAGSRRSKACGESSTSRRRSARLQGVDKQE